jgi:hypothetical protein
MRVEFIDRVTGDPAWKMGRVQGMLAVDITAKVMPQDSLTRMLLLTPPLCYPLSLHGWPLCSPDLC